MDFSLHDLRCVVCRTISRRIIAFPILICACNPIARADEVRAVVVSSTPFTESLGGRKIGELYITAPTRVLETKGDWVRVSAEGWVKSKDLSAGQQVSSDSTGSQEAKAAASKALATVQQDVLSVVDFITAHRTDIDPPRMYVTITVKNLSSGPVGKWSGTLVAQSREGKVLFREPISQDAAKLAPGATTDVTISWEPHEEPYDVLLRAEKSAIQLSLAKVTSSE